MFKILSPKCSKWHKELHKNGSNVQKFELYLNYLKIGRETISEMLITNMNQTFLKDCNQSVPSGTKSGTKKWNKCPKTEISVNFFKIWHRAYILDAADYEYRQRL